MAGNFSLKKFSDIDLNDPFFDSLKEDYPVGGTVKPLRCGFLKKLRKDAQPWFLMTKTVSVLLYV